MYPHRSMDDIANFLKIEPFAENTFLEQFRIHEKFSVIKDFNNSSIARLTANQLNEINSVASETLSRNGYKVILP